jgi:hypothetical protein
MDTYTIGLGALERRDIKIHSITRISTPTGCLVRHLTLSLPRRFMTVYLDNYFTNVRLFSELRACNFGAVGTTRTHPGPQELTEIKERFSTLEYAPGKGGGRYALFSLAG